MRFHPLLLAGGFALLAAQSVFAQADTKLPDPVPDALPVAVQQITVYSAAIDGNLMGESAERDVFVALPPSYEAEPDRHYPVVYALHGFSISADQWMVEIHAPQTIEGAFARGAEEMIVVFPTSKNAYFGSLYASSETTGDFENFIAEDLVAYIDANYRTIPARESRGLVGHSMGGYGATRIGMKHADVFGALYIMSGGGGGVTSLIELTPEDVAKIEALASPAEAADLGIFPYLATLAKAAAYSPNPQKPPLYLDLPYDKDGNLDEAVVAKWTANAPLVFGDQYIGELERYAAIQIDVGDEDGGLEGMRELDAMFSSYGLDHTFEVYPGTHTSDVAFRFQDHVLPFFSTNLTFE